MEETNGDDVNEQIIYGAPYNDAFSMAFEVDSIISHESSIDGANYVEESSEQSNESSNPTVPAIDPEYLPLYITWGNHLMQYIENPKGIADLHGKRSAELGGLVKFINWPGAVDFLRDRYNITEYNNQMNGIYVQRSIKEFRQNFGFDEANFPFDDKGGPQRTKEEKFGYVCKYWVGKQDSSYKMRKFYIDNAYALFVVFRDATSPAGSPSASTEVKSDPVHTNKKPRVGNNSPFKSSEYNNNAVASPNSQSTSYASNTNYSNAEVAPTNYSQHVVQQQHCNTATDPQSSGTNNNTNNPLLSPEHFSNKLTSLSHSVDVLASRVTKLEIGTVASGEGALGRLTGEQRMLCGLIIRVLRESGGRHKLGKTLATKVRKLVGGTLDTSVVNNLLYTVLEVLGIVEKQDTEWVLIYEKAKEFESQN